MIKIVHLIIGLNTGGAEHSLHRLVTGMDRSRFQNIVVSLTNKGPIARSIEDAGVRVDALGGNAGFGGLGLPFRLATVLQREQPAILQTWLYHADFLGLYAARVTGVKAVLWNVRCAFQQRADTSALTWWVIHRLIGLSGKPDAVVVNSLTGIRTHEAKGYHPKRWEMIPNGFELPATVDRNEVRAHLARELDLPADAPWIGLVARYHPMKGHDTFLRAAALLTARNPEARFLLVGTDIHETNNRLSRTVAELGLSSRVRLLGERRDVQRIVASLDVATSSSTSEGFSNTTAEAMACGVPCVVTDVGDSAHIVGDTGRAVPASDPVAFAAALGDLLDMPPEKRLSLGCEARERVRTHFSLERTIARYEQLYAEFAAKSAAG